MDRTFKKSLSCFLFHSVCDICDCGCVHFDPLDPKLVQFETCKKEARRLAEILIILAMYQIDFIRNVLVILFSLLTRYTSFCHKFLVAKCLQKPGRGLLAEKWLPHSSSIFQ